MIRTFQKRVGRVLTTADYRSILDFVIANIGSGGGGLTRYSAGNGVYVTADGAGITATKGTGTVTITVPPGVTIMTARVYGDDGDLDTGEVTVTTTGLALNTSDSDSYWPFVGVLDKTANPGDPFFQVPYDNAGAYEIFHERNASDGVASSLITGISGDWGLFIIY